MPNKKKTDKSGNIPPNSADKKNTKEKNMLEGIGKRSSKYELIQAIQQMKKPVSDGKTIKSPSQILGFIEQSSETIETLAEKAGISERELLLAIRDRGDIETRKKIAEALNTTYYSIFGK
ncbi:MAG: hypothetical protein AAB336_12025 [Acidobacteriota bacterium]